MRISIITINYNNAIGLSKTIKSVCEQTSTDYEYIIIDGGSNDGSKSLIEKESNYINCWVSEPDNGIYNAMNKGICKSTGDYLLFLNSGDWLSSSTVLQDMHNQLDMDFDIIYGNIAVHDSNDKVEIWSVSDTKLDLDHFCYDTIPHQASFIKKSLFFFNEHLSGYNENLKISSDWAFFFEQIVVKKVTVKHINKIIANYNLEGISATREGKELIKQERESIIDNYYPKYYSLYTKYQTVMQERDKYKELLSRRPIKLYFKLRGIFY